MYKDLAEVIGTGKVVGFFGDRNFPNRGHGKLVKEKMDAFRKLQTLLVALKPKKIYVCPELGLSNSLLSLFLMLDIPYSVVNPYRGYFDNIPTKDKLRMFMGLENSSSVITMSESKPKSLVEQQSLLKESQEFLVDSSELIITAFGNNPHREIVKTTDKVMAMSGKQVIAICYST